MNQACREASKLASDGLDRKLSLGERIKLQIHMSMCAKCKNCHETMKLLRKTTHLISQSCSGEIKLTEKQRAALRKALEQNKNC